MEEEDAKVDYLRHNKEVLAHVQADQVTNEQATDASEKSYNTAAQVRSSNWLQCVGRGASEECFVLDAPLAGWCVYKKEDREWYALRLVFVPFLSTQCSHECCCRCTCHVAAGVVRRDCRIFLFMYHHIEVLCTFGLGGQHQRSHNNPQRQPRRRRRLLLPLLRACTLCTAASVTTLPTLTACVHAYLPANLLLADAAACVYLLLVCFFCYVSGTIPVTGIVGSLGTYDINVPVRTRPLFWV